MIIVEVCCGSYEDVLAAEKGGAQRVELNSALHLGGLTPSLASLCLARKNTDMKIICMVRPRAAGFCYSEEEYQVMLEDAKLLLENGADGLAFGFLNENHTINLERTKTMVELIHSYQKVAVFHRAFDVVNDVDLAIEQLIALKVDRLLTSGTKDKAIDGVEVLKQLQEQYGSQMEIVAGSGINASNVNKLIAETGIQQVHSSCKNWVVDPTTKGNNVSYAYANHDELAYEVVSEDEVRKLVKSVIY